MTIKKGRGEGGERGDDGGQEEEEEEEEEERTNLMQANLARGNIQQLLSNINSVQRLSSAIGTGKDTARRE